MRTLRMASAADAAALLRVYAPYTFAAVSFEEGPPSLEAFAARICDISAVYPYIVCEVDGEIAGYAYAHLYRERAAYRWNVEVTIYLSPAHRSRPDGEAFGNAASPGRAHGVQLHHIAQPRQRRSARGYGLYKGWRVC